LDSLTNIELKNRIDTALGVDIPIEILLGNSNIQQLVNLLLQQLADKKIELILENSQGSDRQNEQQKSAISCLVALRKKGSKLPFFCLPGVNGTVPYLSKLVSYLSEEQPFYSFQAPGWNGKSLPLNRIPTLASTYIKELRQFQPEGPYLLGGHCFGGIVAFEMAHQLQQQGQDVPLLILIDAFPSINDSNLMLDPNEDKYKTFSTLMTERACTLGLIEINLLVNVVKAGLQALSNYVLHELSQTKIVLFRAKEVNPIDFDLWFSKSRCQDPSWGWQHLSSKRLEVNFTPGDHLSILIDPHVKHLAEQIESKLLELDINN
ncbi:MAG TPA: thioesterase domain-containing protein, partial [Nodularia sp. (in: cyanobacteria)]|nr:thioesterase domain-containing protein [Nodularia sp. (in: cyanobacteria)]